MEPEMPSDTHNLERFVSAQNADGTYERALEELRQGQKMSHWMWFVFPQIAGLGQSSTSRFLRSRRLRRPRHICSMLPLGRG